MEKTGKATADTATATHAASGTAKRTTTARKSDTSASTSSAGEQPKTTASAPKATTPDGGVAGGDAGEQEPSATARAEEVFDDAGQRVGQFALIAGQYLRQFTARAREEAEDIWVEAQNVRGKKPSPPT